MREFGQHAVHVTYSSLQSCRTQEWSVPMCTVKNGQTAQWRSGQTNGK
jgi:hypothetical protein